MSKKSVTRIELLNRWRLIEEEDDDENEFDHSKQLHIRQLKEIWFSDAFKFLIDLPRENHIWCGSWEIMGPLLETFYNYFKDEREDSPLKILWKRVCEELQVCMQCICQHHRAKETYAMEYELSSIGPLLDVLCRLDEERVTHQLKQMNTQIAQGNYDPVKDNAKVISVMYEVLMFPVLLDDLSLGTEFQIFMEAVDDSHDLTFASHQQYPGVYALFFLKNRRCRSIGFRLAGNMGKLRSAEDLDSLQPLLKKWIEFLETEAMPTTTATTSRPRMQLDRVTVWIGIKALLGFLEPHAFEEGILERYPSFLSIVLNHISDEFSYAINCLRLLFDMLGCKLWLEATLSPSVIRDTLLGQCFHTQDEKSHKEIFDLFLPFLQSLEALQDGEHKKQRRHFLYFLLHQVTVSSNFSTLMRKKACQIALLIIHRGYKMNPSCPPFECAHMWGPSLVASLKDSSLYSSLRQPAFDLIQTILVSDASALVSSILHYQLHKGVDRNHFKDEDGSEEEKDTSCWNDFRVQGQTTTSEFGEWMCIPMLWVDVLVEIDPAVLPVSFSKAVLWGLSRFSMIEPESSTEMGLPIGDWLTTRAPEVSHLFGWRTPSGSDDGQESKNSVKVTSMCIPLIRTFRRLTSHFISRMELWKQWTWEPRMAESLILLLVDPDDNARQVGRRILEQVANTRGLLSCLQFLCSCSASLSSVFLGLKHARDLLLLDSVLQTFQNVHHFFFVLCKLLKEGVQSNEKFSSQGGFLQHPTNIDEKIDSTHWKKFCLLVSEVAWPSFCICLSQGKTFIDYKISQMTCIRLLECLPVVLQTLQKIPGDSDILVKDSISSYKWVHDLMYWGKSTLAVVLRYWKQTLLFLLDLLLKEDKTSSPVIMAIEKLSQCESISIDEFSEQVLRLFITSKNESSYTYAPGLLNKNNRDLHFPSKKSDLQSFGERETVVLVSDDETDALPRDDEASKSQTAEASKSGLVDIESVVEGKLKSKKDSQNKSCLMKSCVENSVTYHHQKNTSAIKKASSAKSDRVELVFDAKDDDPWEFALKSARQNQSHLGNGSGPKRKVIQLNFPGENRNRLRGGHQRFKPVRLDDWYRPILEMDYYATVGLSSSSVAAVTVNLKEVPTYFKSADEYVGVFRPLVLEELKAQLRNSFLETSPDEMSCGSVSVMSVERVDDFHLVRCCCVHEQTDLEGSSRTCVENDLVLLTRQPFPNEVHMIGKVERCEKDNKRRSTILMIKLYLQASRLNRAKKLLMERSKWYVYRIMSITSQLREFHALSSLHSSIPLLPVILNPHPPNNKFFKSKMSKPLQRILKSSFNECQLEAITGAVELKNADDDNLLSLIQGPPGTGKTRTIVAIVSALLSLTTESSSKAAAAGVSMNNNNNNSIGMSVSARAWQDAALAKQLNDLKIRRGRVLICAQSNAAVDELVSRISSHGLYGVSTEKPYLVRVGNAKTVHSNSLPFFIDTLVDHRLTEEEKKSDEMESSAVVRSKLEKIVDRIRFLEAKRSSSSSSNGVEELEGKLRGLYSEKKAVYIELATAQAEEKKANEKRKAVKVKLRKSILKEAEIVITTLSGCGGDLYAVCTEPSHNKFTSSSSSESSLFDAVVIDEAAQALEPATLIPLQLLKSKGGRCIMVGDPKQLPATVLSDVASKYQYECSMFERLQKAGHPVTMLTQQYRMHPEICRFPSFHFYNGNLVNGDGMSSKEKPFHKAHGLGPYLFFDVVDGQELHGNNAGSFYNESEAHAAVELVRYFKNSYPLEFVKGRIGIITPYRSQLSLLRSRFWGAFGSTDEMELNTVDGFQGREVDILVVSTVRAQTSERERGGIGFVADVRRMNVALTRPKHSLWILGNSKTLQKNNSWGALVKDAKDRNLILQLKKPYLFPLQHHNNNNSRHQQQHEEEDKTRVKTKRGGAHSNKKRKTQHCDSTSNNEDEGCEGGKEKQSRSVIEPSPPISKRKQQREAVDALLPSAFISSSKKYPNKKRFK